MKYLFIVLLVQDGENRHTHRVLSTTKLDDINKAARLYAKSYYGKGVQDEFSDWFNFNAGSIAVKVENVRELTEFEYKLMSDIFSGNVRKDYFSIVHAGHCEASNREEIQIHCGENGNLFLFQDADKLGFIVDVYGQNDLADTMTIWEDDIAPDEDEPIFTEEAIKAFKKAWGQSHSELCAALGYNKRTSDDIIMLDYFWIAKDKKWYNKEASGFTDMEQLIANYLRNNN